MTTLATVGPLAPSTPEYGGSASSVSRRPASALKLLAEHWLLLDRVRPGAVSRDELEELLGPGCKSARRARLGELHDLQVLCPGEGCSRRRGMWTLAPAGKELVAIGTLAERLIGTVSWIQQLSPHARERAVADVLRALADARVVKIASGLGGGPKRPAELAFQLGLGRDAVHTRLTALTREQVLRRCVAPVWPRETNYELLNAWRCLAPVVVLCVRWELRWARPADPALAADLAGLIDTIAPLADPPSVAHGNYGVSVSGVDAVRPRFCIEIGADGLRTAPPVPNPDVTLAGSPRAWCESLVRGRPLGLEIRRTGERAAMRLLAILHRALFAGLHQAESSTRSARLS